jgi:uncharacterized protein (UPF0332 family)
MTWSGEPREKINKILDRARSDLALAQLALENEFYNGTSSRAYLKTTGQG